MARNSFISPDMEDFFVTLTDFFIEAGEKGLADRNGFQFMRRQLVNFLIACGRTTVARARATNPVTLPDGKTPSTNLAFPPGWLKINEADRRRLERCGNAEKFIEALRSIVSKHNKAHGALKRPAGGDFGPPAKRVRRRHRRKANADMQSQTSPTNDNRAMSSTPDTRNPDNADLPATVELTSNNEAVPEAQGVTDPPRADLVKLSETEKTIPQSMDKTLTGAREAP